MFVPYKPHQSNLKFVGAYRLEYICHDTQNNDIQHVYNECRYAECRGAKIYTLKGMLRIYSQIL